VKPAVYTTRQIGDAADDWQYQPGPDPDFRYQPIAAPEELGNGGRVRWVSGRPGEAPAYAGTDFIIERDGRIAAVYLFFDPLP
jgi:hypothetical protein